MVVNLEEELGSTPAIIVAIGDDIFANKLYAAMCNMQWKKLLDMCDEEKIIKKLKGDEDLWSCTRRYAGGIVAELRNLHYGKNEDYIHYYCSGNEGFVDPDVSNLLANIGWIPAEWPDTIK